MNSIHCYDKEGKLIRTIDCPNTIPCEISTMWLGVENPGMNVAVYIPEYHGGYLKNYPPMICCMPGGYFVIEAKNEGEETPV